MCCNKMPENCTKEHELTRDVMDQIGFYVSKLDEEDKEDVVKVFTGWARWSGIRFSEPESVALALEYFRKLCKIRKEDLEKAVLYDHISYKPVFRSSLG